VFRYRLTWMTSFPPRSRIGVHGLHFKAIVAGARGRHDFHAHRAEQGCDQVLEFDRVHVHQVSARTAQTGSRVTFTKRVAFAAMIVLDTNELRHARPPDGPLLAMLQTLAKQTGHTLALPEIVLEEHLGHYGHAVNDAYNRRLAATRDLRMLVRHWSIEDRPLTVVPTAVQDRTSRLQQVFIILRTPDWASREALIREARRTPPASLSWDRPGSGARDVAIWLTAVDKVLTDDDLEVYFVSRDSAAFGKEALKAELAAELLEKLGARAGAFHYCNGLGALLAELATKHPEPPNTQRIAATEFVREAVLEALAAPDLLSQLTGAAGLMGAFSASISDRGTLTNGTKAGQVVAYEIGGEVWACAALTWDASKILLRMLLSDASQVSQQIEFTFKVTTTLVMQIDRDGSVLTAEVADRSQAFNVQARVVT